jgi:hypothetical protein
MHSGQKVKRSGDAFATPLLSYDLSSFCEKLEQLPGTAFMPFARQHMLACARGGSGGDQKTLQIEMVVDGIVDGQKTLHRSRRLEPAHTAFSSARRPPLMVLQTNHCRAMDVKPLPDCSVDHP